MREEERRSVEKCHSCLRWTERCRDVYLVNINWSNQRGSGRREGNAWARPAFSAYDVCVSFLPSFFPVAMFLNRPLHSSSAYSFSLGFHAPNCLLVYISMNIVFRRHDQRFGFFPISNPTIITTTISFSSSSSSVLPFLLLPSRHEGFSRGQYRP